MIIGSEASSKPLAIVHASPARRAAVGTLAHLTRVSRGVPRVNRGCHVSAGECHVYHQGVPRVSRGCHVSAGGCHVSAGNATCHQEVIVLGGRTQQPWCAAHQNGVPVACSSSSTPYCGPVKSMTNSLPSSVHSHTS